jgi:predicted transcriptional regulator
MASVNGRKLMGSESSPEFSQTEIEVYEILEKIGLKPNESRILVLFLRGEALTSREIERQADLRQPEVSIALTALGKRGWVCTASTITQNKGRPIKLFTLAQPVSDIMYQIKAGIQGEFSKQIAYVDRVSELVEGDAETGFQEPIIEADQGE